MKKRVVRVLSLVVGALLLPWAALYVASWFLTIPDLGALPEAQNLRIFDRQGELLQEARGTDGVRHYAMPRADVPRELELALLAAEDAHFYFHPGVDPIAMVRAATQAVLSGRIVSGASTLTQQLARTTFDRRRSILGKLHEIALAFAIERRFSKAEVLEAYLNRVSFGPNIQGVDAASRYYFDKPASQVDLVEAATLAAMPRGPSLYDPRRGSERLKRRRDRILTRLYDGDAIDEATWQAALARPVRLQTAFRGGGAQHLVRALSQGKHTDALEGSGGAVTPGSLRSVVTTLDSALQASVAEAALRTKERLTDHDASAASVLVVDNLTAEVLAYVGSPDFDDVAALGQNDGVTARRQPGSALKPFLYATAIEELRLTGSSLLPDIELEFHTAEGVYRPENYDRRFHGPVRLREALGSSLNVPAVHLTSELTPALLLTKLHELGFASLDQPASHYGVALALGDGEVTLFELARAYVALASGGLFCPLRVVREATDARGQLLQVRAEPARRVLSRESALLVTDILSDASARLGGFGQASVFDFEFPVAVKTGTSKGYRDNWAVGFTKERTVAVWVGNFDGHPMKDSSGLTGAGPLLREVMELAMRGVARAPLVPADARLEVSICVLSGARAGGNCRASVRERFLPGTEPSRTCDMHVREAIEPSTGHLADVACPGTKEQIFERYPARYQAWATRAGRPLIPTGVSTRCPPRQPKSSEIDSETQLIVTSPRNDAVFLLDPALPDQQQRIELSARGAAFGERVRFRIDGALVGDERAPHGVSWTLRRGEHTLVAESSGGRSAAVEFRVE